VDQKNNKSEKGFWGGIVFFLQPTSPPHPQHHQYTMALEFLQNFPPTLMFRYNGYLEMTGGLLGLLRPDFVWSIPSNNIPATLWCGFAIACGYTSILAEKSGYEAQAYSPWWWWWWWCYDDVTHSLLTTPHSDVGWLLGYFLFIMFGIPINRWSMWFDHRWL